MKGLIKMTAAILAIAIATACSESRWQKYHSLTCGTVCNITYCSDDDLSDSIAILLLRIEKELSVFDTLSPVSALNRQDSVRATTILQRAFNASKDVSRASGGAFDPTVGPLVQLWGFGTEKDPVTPSDAAIDSAMATVGIDSCHISPDGIITKKHPATAFNFGAIGKGLAASMVTEMLQRNGVTDCMVEIGGDLSVIGKNPRGTKWIVQIDAPIEDATPGNIHEELVKIDFSDGGVATSGNYRNYRDTDMEGRVGHTISPVTGRPIKTEVLSATVIAPDAALADGLATACMVLGRDEALALADSIDGVEIMLVVPNNAYPSGESQWMMISTAGFPTPRY